MRFTKKELAFFLKKGVQAQREVLFIKHDILLLGKHVIEVQLCQHSY